MIHVDRTDAWSPVVWLGRLGVGVGRDYAGKRFQLTVLWQGKTEAHDWDRTLLRW